MIKGKTNYKKILILLATFFVGILIVDAYNESKTSFNNQNNAYTPFKNELKDTAKYLIIEDDLPFLCSIISNKLFCEDTPEYGYMAPINKDEYLVIGEKSYLTAILDYWTLTSKDTTNGYVIKKSGINVQNKEIQTGVRASVFVKPNIKFTGEGTITNPFKFIEETDTNPIISVKTEGSVSLSQGVNNLILDTYFNYDQNGGTPITSKQCVNTSSGNVVVTNTNTLTTGTHIIKCSVSKESGLSAFANKTIIIEAPSLAEADDGSYVTVPGSSLAWRIAYIEGGIIHLVTVGAPLYIKQGCTCVPSYAGQGSDAYAAITTMNNASQSYLVSTYATAIKAVDHVSFAKMASYNCSITVPKPYYYFDYQGIYSSTGTDLSTTCSKKDVYIINTNYYLATLHNNEGYQVGLVTFYTSWGGSGGPYYGLQYTHHGAGYSNEINGYYRLDMTLKAGVKITSGAGTAANPYIIGI